MNIRDITFEITSLLTFLGWISESPNLVITRFIHVEMKKWERQLPNDK